jgi:dephospho-CoA kinase
VIGVTGGIATGKSTVLAILRELGAFTIDADAVYHRLIGPGGDLVAPVMARFGEQVEGDDGAIDRRALAGIVFADPAALADLDRITHPAVISAISAEIGTADASVVAVDAIKLIESGMHRLCDAVWLVSCDPAVQKARLMARNGLTRDEADLRLAAQPDEAYRRQHADIVLDNSGDKESLRRQIDLALTLVKQLPKC